MARITSITSVARSHPRERLYFLRTRPFAAAAQWGRRRRQLPSVDGTTPPPLEAVVPVAAIAPASLPAPTPTLPLAHTRQAGFEVAYTTDSIRRVRLYPHPNRLAVRVSDAAGAYPIAGLCPTTTANTTVFCHPDGTVRVQPGFGRPAFLVGSVRTAVPVAGENPGEWVMAAGERLYVVSPESFERLAPQLMALVNRRSRLLARTDVATLMGGIAARARVAPEDIAFAVITRLP